jgi:hypothetical protein
MVERSFVMEENINEVIEEIPLLEPGPNKNWVY